jgi:uncharacterized repeat protein (TIGR01451 family)
LASKIFVFALLCALVPQSRAALSLNVTASPVRVSLGGTVTYSISVSNTLNSVSSVQVISQFPASANIVSAANNFSPGQVTTNSGQIVFSIDLLPNGSLASFTLQLQPATSGDFANAVTVQGAGESPVSTNVVVTVSAPETDLGITAAGIPPTVVVGDTFNYTVTITNAGAAVAGGVNILSTLPTGISFVSVAPTIPSSSPTNSLLLTPGTLTNGTSAEFVITLLAQTNGNFNLTTSVLTTQNTDTVTSNNTVTVAIKVIGLVTNTVAIVSVSPMLFNHQTALLEQVVVVSNLTSAVIDSVRVLATNIVAPNQLFNATGTNNGHPYVVVPGPLGTNATASVNLQFFITNRTVIDPGLMAVEGPNLATIPVPTGTFIPVTVISSVRNGGYSSVLLEFPTTVGRKYSLVYTPTVDGTNRVALFPPFVANSTHGQFIDSGPQISGDGNRFYSVIEQP